MRLTIALIISVSLGLSQAGGAQPLPENIVLIPFGSSTTPGAHGAIWSTDATIWVDEGEVRVVNAAGCMIGFCDTIYETGKSTVTEVPVAIVENRDEVTFAITVTDLIDPLKAETRIPCADLREMSQDSVTLLGVPVSVQAREHVRIYLLHGLEDHLQEYRVILQVFDATTSTNATPLLTKEISIEAMVSQYLVFGSSFISDLSAELDALNVDRVRISLSENTDAYLWAFATVTNNESNHPVVIAPE